MSLKIIIMLVMVRTAYIFTATKEYAGTVVVGEFESPPRNMARAIFEAFAKRY